VRHRRASTSGAIINQWLQTANIKYWSKNFPLTNSTEVINTRNSYNSLSLKTNNQFESKNLTGFLCSIKANVLSDPFVQKSMICHLQQNFFDFF
jgi:hypothetical protein